MSEHAHAHRPQPIENIGAAALPSTAGNDGPPAGMPLAAAVAALVGSFDDLAGIQRVTIELGAHVVTITQA